MEKYSLEAKELLSESQMFEVKAGAVVKDHLQQECSLCDSCIGCASACAVCVNDVLKFKLIVKMVEFYHLDYF